MFRVLRVERVTTEYCLEHCLEYEASSSGKPNSTSDGMVRVCGADVFKVDRLEILKKMSVKLVNCVK